MNKKPNLDLEFIRPPLSESNSRLLPALLWSGLLIWIIRVTIFVRQRSGSEFAGVDAYAGLQIAIVFFLLMLLVFVKRTYVVLERIIPTSFLILIIYYFVCGLSFTWSFLPQYSLFRAFEFIVLLVATITALSYSKNFISAERSFLLISIIVMFLGICMNLKLTNFNTTLSALHTNSYSASAGMVFTYCFGEYFQASGKRKKLLMLYVFVGLIGVILGTSSASILSIIGGCCLVLFFNKNYLVLSILVCIAVISLIFDIDLAFIKNMIFYGKSEVSIETGTGRFIIWQHYLKVFQKSPFFGHGFAVLSTVRGAVISSQPHNSLFSAVLGTGIVGISVVLAFLGKLFLELLPAIIKKIPGGVGSAAALATGFVNSLSNPYLFDRWEESSLTFSCLLAFFTLFVLLPTQQRIKLAKTQRRKKSSINGYAQSSLPNKVLSRL